MVAVSLENSAHTELLRELKETFMLICCVDENGLARRKATDDEHIVVVGTNDEFVDLDI
jgi:hypothetical protein